MATNEPSLWQQAMSGPRSDVRLSKTGRTETMLWTQEAKTHQAGETSQLNRTAGVTITIMRRVSHRPMGITKSFLQDTVVPENTFHLSTKHPHFTYQRYQCQSRHLCSSAVRIEASMATDLGNFSVKKYEVQRTGPVLSVAVGTSTMRRYFIRQVIFTLSTS